MAKGDVIVPADLTLAAYERAGEPKKPTAFDGGHVDPYSGPLFPETRAAPRDGCVRRLTA